MFKVKQMPLAFLSPSPLTLHPNGAFASRKVCCSQSGTRWRRRSILMSSTNPSEIIEGPFQGAYGNWYLTRADVTDVQMYRAALGAVCAAQSACILLAIAQAPIPSYIYDALFVVGTSAFGVALSKIHIYMKPLHTALKFLWAAGLLGAIAILATEHALVPVVYEKPLLLLATGWQFVALTGVFIKEAFCFGRAEAVGLTALTPVLVGGHFLGILPDIVERGGGLLFATTFLYFCWRKFTQGVKDDVGDLSVFQYLAKNASQ